MSKNRLLEVGTLERTTLSHGPWPVPGPCPMAVHGPVPWSMARLRPMSHDPTVPFGAILDGDRPDRRPLVPCPTAPVPPGPVPWSAWTAWPMDRLSCMVHGAMVLSSHQYLSGSSGRQDNDLEVALSHESHVSILCGSQGLNCWSYDRLALELW